MKQRTLRLTPNWLLLAASLVFFAFATAFAAQLKVVDTQCEHRVNPLGIDTGHPRFSWVLESQRRGERQTSYEILAASSEAKLASGKPDLWASGRIESPESLGIAYAGQPLHSGQKVYWKVRIWDRDGKCPNPAKDT